MSEPVFDRTSPPAARIRVYGDSGFKSLFQHEAPAIFMERRERAIEIVEYQAHTADCDDRGRLEPWEDCGCPMGTRALVLEAKPDRYRREIPPGIATGTIVRCDLLHDDGSLWRSKTCVPIIKGAGDTLAVEFVCHPVKGPT